MEPGTERIMWSLLVKDHCRKHRSLVEKTFFQRDVISAFSWVHGDLVVAPLCSFICERHSFGRARGLCILEVKLSTINKLKSAFCRFLAYIMTEKLVISSSLNATQFQRYFWSKLSWQLSVCSLCTITRRCESAQLSLCFIHTETFWEILHFF